MAKMITYFSLEEAARNYNLSPDTVRHFLQKGEFKGAFQGGNKSWNIPEPEAERVLAKFKTCKRLKDACKDVGVDQSSVSTWVRMGKVIGYKPVVGSNGKTGATYVDMDSLRAYMTKRIPPPSKLAATSSIFDLVEEQPLTLTPTPAPTSLETAALKIEIAGLRTAVHELVNTIKSLDQSVAYQGTNSAEMAKQLKNLSDWLGELAIQKAQS